jgi:hypothetical protein
VKTPLIVGLRHCPSARLPNSREHPALPMQNRMERRESALWSGPEFREADGGRGPCSLLSIEHETSFSSVPPAWNSLSAGSGDACEKEAVAVR